MLERTYRKPVGTVCETGYNYINFPVLFRDTIFMLTTPPPPQEEIKGIDNGTATAYFLSVLCLVLILVAYCSS